MLWLCIDICWSTHKCTILNIKIKIKENQKWQFEPLFGRFCVENLAQCTVFGKKNRNRDIFTFWHYLVHSLLHFLQKCTVWQQVL